VEWIFRIDLIVANKNKSFAPAKSFSSLSKMFFVSIPIEILFLILLKLDFKAMLYFKATSRECRKIMDNEFGVNANPRSMNLDDFNFKIRKLTVKNPMWLTEWKVVLMSILLHRAEEIYFMHTFDVPKASFVCPSVSRVTIPNRHSIDSTYCDFVNTTTHAFPNIKKIEIHIKPTESDIDRWIVMLKNVGKLSKLHKLVIWAPLMVPRVRINQLGFESLRTIRLMSRTHDAPEILHLLEGSQVTTMIFRLMKDGTGGEATSGFEVKDISPLKNLIIIGYEQQFGDNVKVDINKDMELLSFTNVGSIALRIAAKKIKDIKLSHITKTSITGSQVEIEKMDRVVAGKDHFDVSNGIKVSKYIMELGQNSVITIHSFNIENVISLDIRICFIFHHMKHGDQEPSSMQCYLLLGILRELTFGVGTTCLEKISVTIGYKKYTLLKVMEMARPYELAYVKK
jgi:hypothetical protein